MFLRHSRGFNLVELMVAMVAGLLLVAAASALFAGILKANKHTQGQQDGHAGQSPQSGTSIDYGHDGS